MAKEINMTERMFQEQIEHIARMNSWMVFHPSPHQVRPGTWRSDGKGFPDLCLAHPMRGLVFAELKTDKGKLTDEQITWGMAISPFAEYHIWRPGDIVNIADRLGRMPQAQSAQRIIDTFTAFANKK